MGSRFMFQFEEEQVMDQLWNPMAADDDAFAWPTGDGSGLDSPRPGTSSEDSNESVPPPMWASGPLASNTHWSRIDEDTVLFAGDFSELGVDALYEEGVIADSCVSSRSGTADNTEGEEDEDDDDVDEEAFGDLEEQVRFYECSLEEQLEDQKKKVILECPPKEEPEKEVDSENVECTSLVVKIEPGSCVASSVTTPEVLDDVIMLEDEGFFMQRTCHEIPIKTEDSLDCIVEYEEQEEESQSQEYGEYVVDYVDEALVQCSPKPEPVTDTSRPVSEFEDDPEDDDYLPEEYSRPRRRTSRTSTRASSVCSSTTSGGIKKRGRPAKPLRTHLTKQELEHLCPEEKLTVETRFRNNEASRRSRFKRRDMGLKLSEQCEVYDRENRELRRILKKHKQLHAQLRAAFVGIRIN